MRICRKEVLEIMLQILGMTLISQLIIMHVILMSFAIHVFSLQGSG